MKRHYYVFTAAIIMIIGSCSGTPKDKSGESGNESGNETSLAQPVAGNEEAAGKKEHGTIMLTKEDFLEKVMNYEKNQTEWVFEGDKPALIDFYADWCAPCRTTSPILEELAIEYKDKIDIYKIDTEAERELAAVFGIQSLPTFLFVPMEGKPTMSSGIARTEEETKQLFRSQIEELLLQ
jgi:thioredoxin